MVDSKKEAYELFEKNGELAMEMNVEVTYRTFISITDEQTLNDFFNSSNIEKMEMLDSMIELLPEEEIIYDPEYKKIRFVDNMDSEEHNLIDTIQ